MTGTAEDSPIDELEFYDWLNTITKLAQEHTRARDIKGLSRILKSYRSMYRRAQQDPLLSILETANANGVLMLANAYLDDLDFDNCMLHCSQVKMILEAKTKRYQQHGERPRPDSFAWCRLISILADAKWKGPSSIRLDCIPLNEMLLSYIAVESSTLAAIEASYLIEERKENALEDLRWCRTQLHRMGLRYQTTIADIVASLPSVIFDNIRDDEACPFLWSIRLTECWLSGPPTPQDLTVYYSRLLETTRLRSGIGYNLSSFRRSMDNERHYLQSHRPV